MLDDIVEKGDLDISLLRIGYDLVEKGNDIVCRVTCWLEMGIEGGCGTDRIAVLTTGEDVLCLGHVEIGISGINKPGISGAFKNPVCI